MLGYIYFMANTLNPKSLILGAILGIAAVCLGSGVARAECDYPEPIHTAYELAFAMAEDSCDYMAQGWIEDGLSEEVVGGAGGMYEACMRLSVPPMVLSPAQHYDTTDGAFWRTVEQ